MPNRKRWTILGLLAVVIPVPRVAAAPPTAPSSDPAGIEFFESKIRPLFADRCYRCHSAEAEKLKGGLRLDSPAGILAGGESEGILAAGQPEQSRIVDAVRYQNVELQMPPKGKLADAEIELIIEWVRRGAPMPQPKAVASDAPHEKAFDLQKRRAAHWAWQPVRATEPPAVKDAAWAQSPIDRFLLAKLEGKGLSPAVPAEKPVMIRRAYFDLIGLPPSPAEVEAFVNDPAPDAFEKVVDRLLASEHFGERWARHWMDLVRYAETYGHEFDYPIKSAQQYVLYLIRAFNADVPYDRFVTEQLAGDLLPDPRRHPAEGFDESIIGTGFWFLGEQTHSPVDARQHQADRIDNQIDVFGKAIQGLTIACARCHDHKFDAISAKDYYALFGVLESTRLQQAELDPHAKVADSAAKLRALRVEADRALRAALPEDARAAGERFAKYVGAAREVDAASDASPEVVFEDFEGADYAGWTVEGTAFGTRPQTQKSIGDYQGDVGAAGAGFINSHNIHNGEDVAAGDRHTGKLTSKAFTIDQPMIRFLIGGGAHAGKTCLNVVIDGEVVRSATGRNDNRMAAAELDVSAYIGKVARIEIVDAADGPWGNIGVDRIVFAGERTGASHVDAVASKHGLDRGLLAGVVERLKIDGWDGAAQALKPSSDSVIFENFDKPDFASWFVMGEAFGAGPTRSGASNGTGRLHPPGVAHSGVLGPKFRCVLRSKSFVLSHKRIHVRAAGAKSQVRLVVNGYVMDEFSGLLFEGFRAKIDTPDGTFRWHEQNVERYLGHRAHVEIVDDGDGWVAVDEIRFSDAGPPAEGPLLDHTDGAALACAIEELRAGTATPADVEFLNWALEAGLLIDPGHAGALARELEAIAKQVDAVDVPVPATVIAAADGDGVDSPVFLRGSHKKPGDVVPRRFLEAFAVADNGGVPVNGSGRLELARRVTDPSNPLTSRVIVNRVWHHLFGRGIVPTLDDFGVMGQPPTHPELLDHLAWTFVNEQGWSLKRLIRSLMLTRAYQMASVPSEQSKQLDPANALLQHARVRRLQAEAIRDSILAVSGRLDRTVGPPFVEVYLTPFMEGRGRPESAGPLDGNGRRSIYSRVRRNFLPPMMLAFDMPIPFSTIGRRSESNVPAQALILLNDPFVIEQCTLWASRVLAEEGLTTEQRIARMYETAFARRPTEAEVSEGVEFLNGHAKDLGVASESVGTDKRVWTDLAHVLVNVKEFIFLN